MKRYFTINWFWFLIGFLAALAIIGIAKSRASTFEIDSATFNDGVENLAPYEGKLDNVFCTTYCIDLQSTVGFGQQFNVSVINLSTYTGPLATEYVEAAYIVLKLQNVTDVGTASILNRAIWDITSPGNTNPYLQDASVLSIVQDAQQNYQTVDRQNFDLLLKDGVGQNQLMVVPEPEIYASFTIGLISLLGFIRLGQRKK